MAEKRFYIGSYGPFYYDDAVVIDDSAFEPDTEFGAEVQQAFTSNGSISIADLILSGLTASRLISSDAGKKLVSVANLASWIAGVANRTTITDDGDGTITITLPQDIHTGATPEFAGATLTGNLVLVANSITGTLVDISNAELQLLSAITAAGGALIDDANAAAQRTTLGLVIGTDVLAEQTINVPHTIPTAETRTVGTNEQLSVHGGILTLVGDLDLEGNSELYVLT